MRRYSFHHSYNLYKLTNTAYQLHFLISGGISFLFTSIFRASFSNITACDPGIVFQAVKFVISALYFANNYRPKIKKTFPGGNCNFSMY